MLNTERKKSDIDFSLPRFHCSLSDFSRVSTVFSLSLEPEPRAGTSRTSTENFFFVTTLYVIGHREAYRGFRHEPLQTRNGVQLID